MIFGQAYIYKKKIEQLDTRRHTGQYRLNRSNYNCASMVIVLWCNRCSGVTYAQHSIIIAWSVSTAVSECHCRAIGPTSARVAHGINQDNNSEKMLTNSSSTAIRVHIIPSIPLPLRASSRTNPAFSSRLTRTLHLADPSLKLFFVYHATQKL
jgi:hypothetical protein